MHTRRNLAIIARQEAEKGYHGNIPGQVINIEPLIEPFPPMPIEQWDGLWCAAFVHYCCNLSGFSIPVRPNDTPCTMAGCIAWEKWAIADSRVDYIPGDMPEFVPEAGDIVLFNCVFENKPHDHIGIVLNATPYELITAEGNVENVSVVIHRKRDNHIRAYIRLPDGFIY